MNNVVHRRRNDRTPTGGVRPGAVLRTSFSLFAPVRTDERPPIGAVFAAIGSSRLRASRETAEKGPCKRLQKKPYRKAYNKSVGADLAGGNGGWFASLY
jgi:hypothetical protein